MASPALKRNADHLSASSADSKKTKSASITSFFGPPKSKAPHTTQGMASAPVPPGSASFNKAKWVTSLTAEQKELLQLEIDTLDESWLAHLKDEVVTTEFLNLKRFLKKEKDSNTKVFPPEEDIYSWYLESEPAIPCLVLTYYPGPDTRLCTVSKLSSSARIHTTMTIKLTA